MPMPGKCFIIKAGSPSMSFQRRFIVLIFFSLVTLGFYVGVQKLVLTHFPISTLSLKLPGEENIPFIPSGILVYLLVYLLPPVVFLSIKQRGRILKTLTVFLVATFIHVIFFVVMPVPYVLRPELKVSTDLLVQLTAYFYTLDAPINTFPSMHVSFAFLSYFIMRRYRTEWAHGFLFLAISISLSTMLIKQHYVADVAAGLLLAFLLDKMIISRRLGNIPRA